MMWQLCPWRSMVERSSMVEQKSNCIHCITPCQSKGMPKGGCNPCGKPMLEQGPGRTCGPMEREAHTGLVAGLGRSGGSPPSQKEEVAEATYDELATVPTPYPCTVEREEIHTDLAASSLQYPFHLHICLSQKVTICNSGRVMVPTAAWVANLDSRLKRNNDGPEKRTGFYINPGVELDQPHVCSLAWNLDTLIQRSGQFHLEMSLPLRGLCSVGGAKNRKERSQADGNEVDQEKQNEGSQMPVRGLTLELKLWNDQQRLHRTCVLKACSHVIFKLTFHGDTASKIQPTWLGIA
ncbi:hypothetical protein WISP_130575 [Willisornis vidua]|uniref:Uncharacterized protein n=1 Tax=Willisornis vidua TaxID=1566151 RepID=A0ABQ9CPQ3_9PASS|nr:hypothetical protein WISP_130575 [Willisornis vidua]